MVRVHAQPASAFFVYRFFLCPFSPGCAAGAEENMQKILFRSLMLAGAGASLSIQAASNGEVSSMPETLVTATRTDTVSSELATGMTIYTREDIEQRQINSVPELLRGTIGLDINQSGGYGKTTGVFMRGTNAEHVLVMIDGIKVGSVTLGTTPFELIPIDQVERVEIIRGPQSSLYGSEAVGGVIQIFTRKGSRQEKPNVTLDAGAGSFDTYRTAGTISGKWQNNWYTLGASHLGTEGINAHQIMPAFDQPDRDGYENTGINARAGHRFDNAAEVEAFFMRSEGTTKVDGYAGFGPYVDNTKFNNQVVGLTGSMDLVEKWHATLRLGQSQDNNDNIYQTGGFANRFNTTRWNVSWLNDIALTDNHKLTLGSDYRLDEMDTFDNDSQFRNQKSRYDVGVFGELHSRVWQNHFVNASLRWDYNQAFGDKVTGNFGWRYNWEHGLSAFASFGSAFRAPTFNELYYKDAYGSHGNPNVKAEDSTTFEAGLAGNHAALQWELRAYHTNIDNLITWTETSPFSYIYTPENIGKAQIDGLEGQVALKVMGWQNKLNLNLLSPRDRESNLDLPNRASQTLSYDLSRSFGSIDVGGNLIAQGSRYADKTNLTKVAGYVTLDFRTAYHVDKNWMLSAKLNNVLDKQYQTVNNFNTFGRNFFFSIHYTY
jgi:vitamin B12 transporter